MTSNLSKKLIDRTEIQNTLADWQESLSVAEFFKKKLGKNGNADKIADNIIEKSLSEDRPEWTSLLLDSIKSGEIKQVASTQINFFAAANEQINENIQKLIDVTPATSSAVTKIEGII